MSKLWKSRWACLVLCLALLGSACGGTSGNAGGNTGGNNGGNNNGGNNGGQNNGGGGGSLTVPNVVFTPVANAIAGDLIDLEFLPGGGGASIAIGKGGAVYYLDNQFHVVGTPGSVTVESDGERGLLNVVADPDYATNHFIYLYYTVPGTSPDVNRVQRFVATVSGNTFTLTPDNILIEFSKAQSPNPGSNHNGGSMVFDEEGELLIGVGDGGGSASADTTAQVAQKLDSRLGKVHRILPTPDGFGHNYTVPAGQNVSGAEPTIYVRGLRNPFTMVLDDEDDLFIGDVGNATFEEIDCVYNMGENYGWPLCEGPCDPFNPSFQDPVQGYRHDDANFDPEADPSGPISIMVSSYYRGSQYGGAFTNKLIYNEFFAGWVRVLTLNTFDQVIADQHVGHVTGLTGLHENPADGLLYGTSLGTDHLLRLELAP